MKTTFEETEATKTNTSNTWAGFWFCVLIILWCVSAWGSPDLIDALIYYLSDGYYK